MSRSPSATRQNSLRNRADLPTSDSQLELHKYTENDEDDYEDIFDEQATLGKLLALSAGIVAVLEIA